jgi:hypothetical protein
MTRRMSTFRQRDLTAAVKAMTAAGQKLARVEVDKDGRIVMTVARATVEHSADESPEALRHQI